MLEVFARRPDRSVADRLTGFESFTMVERFCDAGRWTLTSTDPGTAFFTTRGTGVVVRRDGVTLMSGPVDYLRREYRDGTETFTVSGPDDTALLARVTCWPEPTASVGAQTFTHDKRTGTAEYLVRGYVQDNAVTRMGLPITLQPNQSRGSTRTVRARFRNLLEFCQGIVRLDSGFGFRVVQNTARQLALDFYQGEDRRTSALLSDQTGSALEWEYVEEYPTATRVIIAGGGQGVDRKFRRVISTPIETNWAMKAEAFLDRRDIDPDDPTANAEMDEAGNELLAEQSPVQSFRMWVDGGFAYGADLRVGDLVRAYPGGVQVEDRITEATVTVDENGETVQVWVGPKDPDPDERRERDAAEFRRRLREIERAY